MRKFTASLALAAMIVGTLAGCGGGSASTYELALVTDLGTIDDKSFNQGAWEGLSQYAQENSKSYKYYKPTEGSNDAYFAAIEMAVSNGAKIVVCPGFLFTNSVFDAQYKYPDVKFILLDTTPESLDATDTRDPIAGNTVSILYREEQPGFLAGYAAVKGGYQQLGFMGGIDVPAVKRYGLGYIEGIEYAAQELDVQVTVKYLYTNSFDATPEAQGKAAAWYASGVEVIFACGGNLGQSVMAAAELATTKVIGVDVDQSSLSASVVNSAMKGLKKSVYDTLKSAYDGSWAGGSVLNLGVESDAVGLAMSSNKIEGFSQQDYDAIYNVLKTNEGGIAASIIDAIDANTSTQDNVKKFSLKKVTVNFED